MMSLVANRKMAMLMTSTISVVITVVVMLARPNSAAPEAVETASLSVNSPASL